MAVFCKVVTNEDDTSMDFLVAAFLLIGSSRWNQVIQLANQIRHHLLISLKALTVDFFTDIALTTYSEETCLTKASMLWKACKRFGLVDFRLFRTDSNPQKDDFHRLKARQLLTNSTLSSIPLVRDQSPWYC
jgi:hypothetical protein